MRRARAQQSEGSRALTVYFDGACPVCAREVAVYRRLAGADSIDWVDASRCDQDALGSGLDRPAALARLHVRRRDGSLVHGAAAFAELWRLLPALSWLGRVASLPPMRFVLDVAYGLFLRVRRIWRPRYDALPACRLRELRSDHAGEAGAGCRRV